LEEEKKKQILSDFESELIWN